VNAASLAAPTREQRDAIRHGPRDVATHARLLAALPFANALDVAPAPSPTEERDPAVVVAWNAERCKFLDESAAFLAAQGADVLLLSELDWGMARSGQHHCARELASRLGCAYAYGVEFLELAEPERSEGGERARGERSSPGEAASGSPFGASVTAQPGFATRAQLVEAYARASGRDVAAIDFYQVLALYKLAVISEGIYARFQMGKTLGPGFENMQRATGPLAERALALADASSDARLRG